MRSRGMAAFRIRRLRRSELPVDTVELARYLVGKTLVRDVAAGRLAGRIVETEAYVVGDAAGHAFIGRTRRNRSLFLERGRAYVYFIYGSYYCLNVAAEVPGVGAGVLLRALEPVAGIDNMARERGTVNVRDLARGPGRLAQATQVDLRLAGVELCNDRRLWLGDALRPPVRISRSVRI